MVYADPLVSVINKIKASSRIIALIPPSRVHAGFIPDSPEIKGLYVTTLSGDLKQIVSSSNQTNQVLQGDWSFQIDALSNESVEDADVLAKTACEACLPSIISAGIFSLNMKHRGAMFDKGYQAYRSTWRLESPSVEYITG